MPFYARYGFAPVGAPFDEAGIPHQAMEARLPVRGR
jgi:predicted GNAT family N-acyltransferase